MMHYYTTTIIHLSLEDFYNDGMTSEGARKIIESIIDPFSPAGLNLRCHRQYVNGNWNVETFASHPEDIYWVTLTIERYLVSGLSEIAKKTKKAKKGKKNVHR